MTNLLEQWRKQFDEMLLQANLGKMDAADAFETQKNNLKQFVAEAKSQLEKNTDIAEQKANELRAKLDELNLQLHLGKAETAEMFQAQFKQIEPALQQVYAQAKEIFGKGYNQAMDVFEVQTSWFKTNLEMMQLQYTLAKMDVKTDAEKIRQQLAEKMDELKLHTNNWQTLAQKNVENWTETANNNLTQFRSWMEQFNKK